MEEMSDEAVGSIAVNAVGRILKEGTLSVLQTVERAVAAVPAPQREDLLARIIGQLTVVVGVLMATTPHSKTVVEKMREQVLFNDVAARFEEDGR